MRSPVAVLGILGEAEQFAAVVEWIRRRGLVVDIVTTADDGLRVHRERGADLIVLGLPLPDLRASAVIGGLLHDDPRATILVVGRDADVRTQLQALELGAQEYVADPVEGRRDLLFALGVSLGVRRTDAHYRVLRGQDAASSAWRGIVAGCPAMKDAMRRLRGVCERSLSGATPTVLLTGEIGTGKRTIAKVTHYNGSRRGRVFAEVNCASLSAGELRARLFGDGHGTARQGALEHADGGSMFLEEIGAMPLDLQGEMLIAIEDKVIRRAGAAHPIHIDLQFLASTRHDLAAMVKRGEFRDDLYHRLSVVSVALPPLRERGDDIVALARALLASIAAEHGVSAPCLGDDVAAALAQYTWPGNLRELRNELERIVLLVDDDAIRAEHLSPRRAVVQVEHRDDRLSVVLTGDRCPLEEVEREVIRQALVRAGGNISRAARFLAITRQTMLYRMKKYGFSSLANASDTA